MSEMYTPIVIQAMTVLSCLSLAGALVLQPLSPPAKRLGYAFMLPLVLAGFTPAFTPDLALEDFILMASYSLPVFLLGLTIFKHSIRSNSQMIALTIIFALLSSFAANAWGRQLLEGINSPMAITVLIILHLVLLFILKRQERRQDLFLFSVLLLSNLIIIYKDIGSYLYMGYFLILTGYALALHGIYAEYKRLHSHAQSEHEEIRRDFRHAVEREVRQRTKHMEWIKEQMREKSKFDDLTGALSKKHLLDLIDSYVHSKDMRKFSILMFDIDNFKTLNDTHGHIAGDRCLKDVVSIAKGTIRENDAIGRFGGDEFFILLPDQAASHALRIAERLRENIKSQSNPTFTISLGVSSYPWDGESQKELIKIADKGLYRSKELGRNRATYLGYLKTDHDFNS